MTSSWLAKKCILKQTVTKNITLDLVSYPSSAAYPRPIDTRQEEETGLNNGKQQLKSRAPTGQYGGED